MHGIYFSERLQLIAEIAILISLHLFLAFRIYLSRIYFYFYSTPFLIVDSNGEW